MTYTISKQSYSRTFKSLITGFVGICAMVMLFSSSIAHANTPTLSLSPQSDGNSVQVTVYGDSNVSVLLYYNKPGVGSQIITLGNTSSSGSLSTIVSSSTYGIVSGSIVHVSTNGLSGPISANATWPTVTTGTSSSITLSQTGVAIPVGQTTTVTATNNTSGSLYVSNNSNPSVAIINVSGTQISITGNTYGSTVATICSVGNTSNCPSIYVTVQNSGGSALVFSQSTVTIGTGQNVPITVSGGNGSYTILNNSNSSIVSASISGNVITLSAPGTYGSSSLTVCSTDMTSCGIINATVGASNTSSTVSFSQSNPVLGTGQSTTISVYGGASTTYYISSNSTPNVVEASIANGNTISLTGITAGSSSLVVCSSLGGCGTLYVSVNYTSSGGNLSLSQSSLTLTTGQTLSITISGGVAPYNLPVTSSSLFQASVSGNVLTISAINAGSAQVAVCSASGGCTWLSLTVNGSSTGSGLQPILSQTSVTLATGQTSTIGISGIGGYYISSNTNQNVATASISGSSVVLYGTGIGSTSITVCQSSGLCSVLYVSVSNTTTSTGGVGTSFLTFSTSSPAVSVGQSTAVYVSGGVGSGYTIPYNSNSNIAQTTISGTTLSVTGMQNGDAVAVVCDAYNNCGPLYIQVGTGSTIVPPPITPPATTTTVVFIFTQHLGLGATGAEVIQLQRLLTAKGLYSGRIDGGFGLGTQAAVERFQSAHGLPADGDVGPLTRAALNRG